MSIHLNNSEIYALTGLPDVQVRLYIFGIRRYMDYSNGIVGVKRRISYQSLSETLYVEPIRGVKTEKKLSRSQLRRAVKALERAGLILIKSLKLQLVLECVLAKQDQYVQNKAVTRATPQSGKGSKCFQFSEHNINTTNYEGCMSSSDPIADIQQFQKAATPPLSDITLSNESVMGKTKRSCSLPENFSVKPVHLELAMKNDWPNPNQEIEAFRDHHLARGNVMRDWDRAFYTWLRNAKRFGANNHAKNRSFSRRSESVIRAYESSAPNVNWRTDYEETRSNSAYGMDQ